MVRLRSIKKGILKEEAATTEKKARLQHLQKQALYGTKRLGRLKYPKPVKQSNNKKFKIEFAYLFM